MLVRLPPGRARVDGVVVGPCAESPPLKFLGQLVQTENTAPPGLTVIVGDRGQPQGTNRLAVTVTVAVGVGRRQGSGGRATC